MARNINLSTMTNGTLYTLSNYYFYTMSATALRKEARDRIAMCQKTLEAVKADREAALASGMEADQAIATFDFAEPSAALAYAKLSLSDLNDEIKKATNAAYDLVPEELFLGYQSRFIDETKTEAFYASIEAFLANMGLSGTEGAVRKLAEALYPLIAGCAKSSGKSKADGHLLKDMTKRSFKDLVLRAFIEYAVFTKGVLDITAEKRLVKHVFEEAAPAPSPVETEPEQGESPEQAK